MEGSGWMTVDFHYACYHQLLGNKSNRIDYIPGTDITNPPRYLTKSAITWFSTVSPHGLLEAWTDRHGSVGHDRIDDRVLFIIWRSFVARFMRFRTPHRSWVDPFTVISMVQSGYVRHTIRKLHRLVQISQKSDGASITPHSLRSSDPVSARY